MAEFSKLWLLLYSNNAFSHKDLALVVDIVLQKARFVWSLIAALAEISFSSDVNYYFRHDHWPHSHFPVYGIIYCCQKSLDKKNSPSKSK